MRDYQFILKSRLQSLTLTSSPIGWDSFNIAYIRSEVYHSVLRNITNTLKFPKVGNDKGGGYEFLLDAYERDGIKAIITLTINNKNPFTGAYEFFYEGMFVFTPEKWNNDKDKEFIEIGLIDSSKLQEFKSNEDIEIDLNSNTSISGLNVPGFVNSPKDVLFRKIDIHLQALSNGYYATFNRSVQADEIAETQQISGEFTNEMGERCLISETPNHSLLIYENNLEADAFFSVSFNGTFRDTMKADNGAFKVSYSLTKRLNIQIFDESDALQHSFNRIIFFTEESNINSFEFKEITGSYTYDLSEQVIKPGWTVKLYLFNLYKAFAYTGGQPTISYVTDFNRCVDTNFKERTEGAEDSRVKSYPIYEALSKTMQLITNEADTSKLIESNTFGRTDSEFETYARNGVYSNFSITSGWNMRRFPNKPFLITFKKLFQSLDSLFCLALMFDKEKQLFKVERRNAAYQNVEIVDLGEVSELSIKAYSKGYYKDIKSGYPKQTFEKFQGINEVNVESAHLIDMPVKTKLNIQSTIKASSIGMELLRRKPYSANASKDTKDDNSIFITHNTENYEVIQGATDVSGWVGIEQYYNFAITPRQNIIRHGGFINQSLFKHPSQRIKKIKYQKEKNCTFKNKYGAVNSELSDIANNELGSLYIKPNVYSFKSIFNNKIVSTLNDNPNGYICFTHKGVTYKGFVLNVSGKPYAKTASYILIEKK